MNFDLKDNKCGEEWFVGTRTTAAGKQFIDVAPNIPIVPGV